MKTPCSLSPPLSQPLVLSFAFAAALLPPSLFAAQPPLTITVRADRPGTRINPAMWGIFFEDINFGADGGLYAELVKNRAFEFPDAMLGWSQIGTASADGKLQILDDEPFAPANPHYLRVSSGGTAPFGVSNEGLGGCGIRDGDGY